VFRGLDISAQIVEAVTGTTYWDYVHEHVFGRCGMTGAAFYIRPQWLTDEHIAHSYMRQADGSRVDAVRNLDMQVAPTAVVELDVDTAFENHRWRHSARSCGHPATGETGPQPVRAHPAATVSSRTGVPPSRGRPPAPPRDSAVMPTRPRPHGEVDAIGGNHRDPSARGRLHADESGTARPSDGCTIRSTLCVSERRRRPIRST
jgi:CubicO group peptidase (beta-lactamase class C family)